MRAVPRIASRFAARTASRFAAPLAALLLAACDRAPAAPVASALRLEATAGDGQRWILGERLPGEPTVRVTRADRSAAAGVRVRFRVTGGGGTVTPAEAVTDIAGYASASWTLGRAGSGAQALVATADELPGRSAAFTARGVDPATVDVVLARGLDPSAARVVFTSRETFTGAGAVVAEVRDATRLVPFDEPVSFDQLVAYAPGHPPVAVAPVTWTPRPDTVVVRFAAAHRLPLTVWIVQPPFEEMAQVARTHVATMNAIYRANGVGVEFADVTIVDATRFAVEFPATLFASECNGQVLEVVGRARNRMNVYYVPRVAQYAGYACGTDWVFMSPNSGRWPSLLAHEIGHTFGLGHDGWGPENVMNPNSPGGALSLGQGFRASFDVRSSLNAVYGLRPESEQRDCQGLPAQGVRAAPCLPPIFGK